MGNRRGRERSRWRRKRHEEIGAGQELGRGRGEGHVSNCALQLVTNAHKPPLDAVL